MSGAARSRKQLLAGYDVPAPDFDVTGVELDSRRVSPGDLFLACKGSGLAHGLAFIEQALQNGAAAVAWEPAAGTVEPAIGIPQVAVPKLAARAGEIEARSYNNASQHVFWVGRNGTGCKPSTPYFKI